MNVRYINILYLLLLSSIILSCKKDRLEDQTAFLIGTWNWTHTVHKYGFCNDLDLEQTLSPISEGVNYSMIFKKRGKVEFYEDDKLILKHRIVIIHYDKDEGGEIQVLIDLDNNEDKRMSIRGNEASSIFSFTKFPYIKKDDCEAYGNFFVKL